MSMRQPLPHSLTTRIAALVLVFLLAGMWSLAWYADHRLRQDMREQLQAQQQAVAALLGREVERTLRERGNALEVVARGLHGSAQELTGLLARQPVLQQMFTAGYYVTDIQGQAIAAYPPQLAPQRRGHAPGRHVQEALAGQIAVSDPMPGLVANRPEVAIAAPVPGADGRPAGTLVGVVKLREDGLLQPLPGSEGQDYAVIDRRTRTVVAASAEQLVLQSLPAAGQDAQLDGILAGGDGSIIRPIGEQTRLASVRHLTAVPWLVVVSQPLAQLTAPLDAMRQHILLAALVLTLLAAGGLWWMLRRALQPLEQMGHTLAAMAEDGAPLQPLAPQKTRELSQLVRGCNHLLAELGQRQQALGESQQRYQAAFQISPDSLDITRVSDGVHIDVNAGFERLFGWPRELVLGRSGLELGVWNEGDAAIRAQFVEQVLTEGMAVDIEQRLYRRDGTPVTVLLSASLLDVAGEPCMLWVAHDVTADRAASEHIRRLTSTDQLTGLPNVQEFLQQLEQAQGRCLLGQRLAALLCVDLDDFKTVNDSQGREHGDQLLREVARRIGAEIAGQGPLARLGGDEFLVLLSDLPGPLGAAARAAEAMAHRLAELLGQPLEVEGTRHSLSVGVGIVVLDESHQESRELLRRAALALNQAKATGPGVVLFFEPQMQDEVSSRARLQRSLREALQQQNFELHYQPQLDQRGAVVGVEALVRWPLQGQGMVSPAEFIPLAEKTGLIVPLGRWILHTACSQLAQWSREPLRRHLDMAVNVSAGQFQQDDFVDQVKEVLAQTGAPADRLKIELTESLMLYEIGPVIERMKELRRLGVRFSLDDFGTGFSSLAYLKRLPLQQLKIDQGFVRDILEDHNDAAIARTVIALGDSLGLEVIAEGVETQAHCDLLAQWGCRLYQGYWFSRPLPAVQLEAFLSERDAAARLA
ncbi:EAL domain-containing protein [Pulveribacter sp.]|uniref:bifunctional diguanylate cyclase/phosphodiesterase n=1 Tax=Pulveribacter sp. TaxID=2678893 RepID=UPI0028AEF3E8|nr:EAL domain-containing protein [Pulveribacter sp.]